MTALMYVSDKNTNEFYEKVNQLNEYYINKIKLLEVALDKCKWYQFNKKIFIQKQINSLIKNV